MSVTVEVGSNVTFDCVGQDDGNPQATTYFWTLFDRNKGTIERIFIDFPDLSSFTIPNIQFSSNIFSVLCSFGQIRNLGQLQGSIPANITLVGW